MVVLDTSIIIDHLRQSKQAESWLMKIVSKMSKSNLALSMVTIQELYEGKSTLNPQKEHYLLSTIAPLTVIPYTYEVAQLAGELARDCGRPIELADAAIAATAVAHGAQLATLNSKDFIGIRNLDLFDLKKFSKP
ncbi:hypothetical protein COS66_03730 [Candidatus Berkelbacteria bacterium CG06_land_8_20_14_3_00_43_10]|uniref:Ribonuclease VapC n=1 Tax=Candidatus Berkelbacteria bacterium CG10_big_fil_rev_8_21_14_0_10_43_14 TaxID=1974515 RepID=A0A2M6RAQ8_9BACT|nr:MAG: hypothetical protein COT79_01165 [Candidatus Berkelbacteria bacterium CG10_big_fil_rev_8_21_14_0_10_43_14]PIU86909.1 MAG: hypothetical protein COS66_03730 [Candidatus Berkelbacteria bacterium CG06_land_8_20_14_3_00_43_10]